MHALVALSLLLLASPAPQMEAGVKGMSVVLTNKSDKACQIVAESPLGTIALTKVEQNGKLIAPRRFDVTFPDSPGLLLPKRLRTLEPGQSAEIPLSVINGGKDLEMITWSDAGPFGSLFGIEPGKPVRVEFTYASPVRAKSGAPMCTAVMGAGEAKGQEDNVKLDNWALYGALILAGVLVMIMLVLLMRRRRTPKASVVILLLLLSILSRPESAEATITIADDRLQEAYDGCIARFREPGGDPAGVLPTLEGPGPNVQIYRPSHAGDNHEGSADGINIFVFWDPSTPHTYYGSGGAADPCSSLYHELHHAWQHATGTYSDAPCATSDPAGRTLPETEVEATRAQNLLRAHWGLPQRDHYEDIPLPDGDCQPPRPRDGERCTGPGCGDSNGDPHIRTFDGMRYDFQAVGEFTSVTDEGAAFVIQARQQPAPGSRTVSMNTAVAMRVGPDKVEFRMTPDGIVLLVNGSPQTLKEQSLPGGGRLRSVSPEFVTIIWPGDGPQAWIRAVGSVALQLSVQPTPKQTGKLKGLFGNFDGNSKNDVADTSFAALYPKYSDSWRIDDKSSLFTYETGKNTAAYTDKAFPQADANTADLPGRAAAEALCKRLGVKDPEIFADCVLDVALTGMPDFAKAAAASEAFVSGGGGDFGGQEWTVRISQPGGSAKVEFNGTGGQKVFLDVPLTTLPDVCGAIVLRGPKDQPVGSGCLLHGQGMIDGVVLPDAGKYTITLTAPEGKTGEARLRLITVVDQQGTITADGSDVVAKVDKPGMVSRFTFTGSAGQKVFIDLTGVTLPDQCGGIDLRGPRNQQLNTGCILGGAGYIDGVLLPDTGTYSIVVDPAERKTGEAHLKLITVVDQTATLSLNGAEVTGQVKQPGGTASFTFTGTNGQLVFIDILSSTLPDQCGGITLRGPNGNTVGSGCILGGKGSINETGTVLTESGTYTVVIDPAKQGTGEVRLRARA